VVILAASLTCGLMLALGVPAWRKLLPSPDAAPIPLDWMIRTWGPSWGVTLLACLAALIAMRGVFLIGYSKTKSAKLLVGVFILLFWAVPPLADVTIATVFPKPDQSVDLTWFFGASPIGSMLIVWNHVEAAVWPGLAAQVALAVVLTLLGHRAVASLRRQPSAG